MASWTDLLKHKSGRVLLRPDGSWENVLDRKLNLTGWQSLVGGFVQVVSVDLGGHKAQAILHEEGYIMDLPSNKQATAVLSGFAYLPPGGARGPVVFAWGTGRFR